MRRNALYIGLTATVSLVTCLAASSEAMTIDDLETVRDAGSAVRDGQLLGLPARPALLGLEALQEERANHRFQGEAGTSLTQFRLDFRHGVTPR